MLEQTAAELKEEEKPMTILGRLSLPRAVESGLPSPRANQSNRMKSNRVTFETTKNIVRRRRRSGGDGSRGIAIKNLVSRLAENQA